MRAVDTYVSVGLSVSQSASQSVSLSVSQSVTTLDRRSVCLSVRSVIWYLNLSVGQTICHPLCLSVCLSDSQSLCLTGTPSVKDQHALHCLNKKQTNKLLHITLTSVNALLERFHRHPFRWKFPLNKKRDHINNMDYNQACWGHKSTLNRQQFI